MGESRLDGSGRHRTGEGRNVGGDEFGTPDQPKATMGESKHTPKVEAIITALRHAAHKSSTRAGGATLNEVADLFPQMLETHQRAHADAEAALLALPSLGGILEAVANGQAAEVGQALNEVSRLLGLISTDARAAIKAATGGEPRQRHDWTLRAHADHWECVHGCGTPGPYKTMTPPDAPCGGRGATGGET